MVEKKILMVEDDPYIRELVSMYVVQQPDWVLIEAGGGEEGLSLYYDEEPDLVLLDLMLPEINGWEICREIRRDDPRLPILMLTAKGEREDVIDGLDLGADDYVTKPFDPKELLARMRALLRRRAPFSDEGRVYRFGDTSVDLQEHTLAISGEKITAAPRELELLAFFISYPGQTLTREQLLQQVWGMEFDGDPRTVDVHIKRLRDKLRRHSADAAVVTIRGAGYRLERAA